MTPEGRAGGLTYRYSILTRLRIGHIPGARLPKPVAKRYAVDRGFTHADLAATRSINNEDRCATFGTGAVRATVVVSHVITCSCRNSQTPTVLMLNDHLTRNNEGQMAFVTPVVANVG